jgi:hypothetical protein
MQIVWTWGVLALSRSQTGYVLMQQKTLMFCFGPTLVLGTKSSNLSAYEFSWSELQINYIEALLDQQIY